MTAEQSSWQGAAPARDLAATATGPLAGIRVLDLTSVVNGSYATQILADQGADVIKVEAPTGHRGGGDTMRWTGRVPAGAPPELGPIFMTINRNKRSVMLDLREPSALDALKALIATCDVLAASVRYDGLRRLGLDYEGVAAIRPDIVYVHTAGYGAGGAYAGDPAYDDLIQAACGLTDLYTMIDGDPTPRPLPTLVADKVSGLFMAQAVTAALVHRGRTGEGQFVEVPMLECLTSFTLVEHLYGQTYAPPVGDWGYVRVANPWRRPMATQDGYIALLPYSDRQWQDFFALVGWAETVGRDPRFALEADRWDHIGALYELLESVTITKTTDEWLRLLRGLAIPATRANRLADLATDPHLASVKLFERYHHPDAGEYMQMRPPVVFGKTPSGIYRHPPKLGEHTAEVLAEFATVTAIDAADSRHA